MRSIIFTTIKVLAWIIGLAVALWYGALGMIYLTIFTLVWPWLVWPEAAIVIIVLLTVLVLSRKQR